MKTGYLSIGTYPIGAQIYIDNTLILDDKNQLVLSPIVLVLPTGYHSVKLALEGYCDEFDGVYVEINENVNIFHDFYICR